MRSSQTKRSAGPSEGVAHKRNLKQKAMTRANKMLLIQNFKNEGMGDVNLNIFLL